MSATTGQTLAAGVAIGVVMVLSDVLLFAGALGVFLLGLHVGLTWLEKREKPAGD